MECQKCVVFCSNYILWFKHTKKQKVLATKIKNSKKNKNYYMTTNWTRLKYRSMALATQKSGKKSLNKKIKKNVTTKNSYLPH